MRSNQFETVAELVYILLERILCCLSVNLQKKTFKLGLQQLLMVI